jgi:hypothetical protein
MRRLRSKKFLWLVLVVILCATAVMCEVIAKMMTYYGLDIRDSDYSHYYREDPSLNLITWVEKYQVHPYFGYQDESIRQFELFREQLHANDFVIGVLGGSVAEMFANYVIREPEALNELRNAIPELARKNLRVVNLAMGGAKQPQQFFIAAYFLDSLDLVVNIDGFNDVQQTNFLPVYPLDFPVLSLRFYDRTTEGDALAFLGRLSIWTYKAMNRLPLRVPILSRSSLYFLVWHAVHGGMYNVVRMLEQSYYSSAIESQLAPGVAVPDSTKILEERLNTWKRYTILQSDLGSRAQKPMFFFLQPNQYLKNSKPLSEEERRTAFREHGSESNHQRMMRLRERLNDLRAADVPIFDLTEIFQNTRETVYRDTCCHLNSRGNEIMGKEIVQVISRYYRKTGK